MCFLRVESAHLWLAKSLSFELRRSNNFIFLSLKVSARFLVSVKAGWRQKRQTIRDTSGEQRSQVVHVLRFVGI